MYGTGTGSDTSDSASGRLALYEHFAVESTTPICLNARSSSSATQDYTVRHDHTRSSTYTHDCVQVYVCVVYAVVDVS